MEFYKRSLEGISLCLTSSDGKVGSSMDALNKWIMNRQAAIIKLNRLPKANKIEGDKSLCQKEAENQTRKF